MKKLQITQKDRKCKIIIDGQELTDVLWYRLEQDEGGDFPILISGTKVTDELQVEIL